MNYLNSLLESGYRIYVAATGAGAGIQQELWNVPGISKVLVGADFPYAKEATDRYLGYSPDHYCDRETAVALAMESYTRAWSAGTYALGLGLTATVATKDIHRGEHRVHAAVIRDGFCKVWTVVLDKHDGSMREEDGRTSDLIGISAIREAIHVDSFEVALEARQFPPVRSVESFDATSLALKNILARPLFTSTGKRLQAPANGNGLVLFPGAFNPPHEGHFWMANEHEAMFQITLDAPHKPSLSVTDVLQRAKLLEGHDRLFTTGDPLYLDKAKRFPGSSILIGVDAIQRMLDPKWGLEIPAMLDEFRKLGIKFLVADRMLDDKLVTLDDIPGAPKDICTRIWRPAQHLGMSSTRIREVAHAKS